MSRRHTAMLALAACVLSDAGNVVNEVLSDDRPPPVAPILGTVFAVLSVAAILGLSQERAWARATGGVSRVGDVLLLTGALLSGGFADEPLAHQVPAGIQFGLSVIALVALARLPGRARRSTHASRAAAR